MKAISFQNAKEVTIKEIPEVEIGSEDVLVDVRYVGLCGSDLNTYRGLMPLISYPLIPGHEVSGVVAAIGKNVPDRVKEGDNVTLSPYTNCGYCPACRIGRTNCCVYNQTLGVQRDGALRERIAVHHSKIFTSTELSLQELALVEPLSVGYHAANRGQVGEVDTVLIMGCGTIGMGAICACARKGATVIAADVDNEKLKLAQKLGAHHTINSAVEDLPEKINKLTQDEGVNLAIEAVGLPQTFQLAVEVAAFAGRVVFIGYAKENVSFETKHFVRKELNIMGSRNALHVFPAVMKMLEKRQSPFLKLVTRTYPLAKTAEAFLDWDAQPGQFTKILIDVS